MSSMGDSAKGLERIFALTSDAVFVDCNGALVAVNPAGVALYRAATVEDLIGRRVTDLVPPTLVDLIASRVDRLADHRETDRWAQEEIVCLDGEVQPVEVRSTPILWDNLPAALVLIRPLVTPQPIAGGIIRSQSAALRVFGAVSLKLARATDDDLDAVIEDVLADISQSAIVDRAYVVQFNDEAGTLSCSHEWCGEGIERQSEYVQGLPLGGFPWSHGIIRDLGRVHVPDVSQLPPEAEAERESFGLYDVRSILSVPIVVDGIVHGLLGFNAVHRRAVWPEEVIDQVAAVADVIGTALTRRRAAQVIIAARDEAERANAVKDRFLSRISHELRTPLNSVLGFSELLLLDEPNEGRRQLLGEVQSSGQLLLSLVDDVLDVTRLTTGELGLEVEVVKVSDVLLLAVKQVEGLADEGGVVINNTVAEASVVVHVDRERLLQVVAQLLKNAVLYNVEGGEVTLSVDCDTDDGSDVRIVIADTGSGMSDDQLERLFEPFDRLGAETSTIPGTGIGLSLVRMIVERMDGDLEITSIVGRGTVATLRF